ncbi:TPA: tRNA (adenosine(37)-N6)-threonylcarbamoyltransferase complex dimerization subunit type 1 TsaB [Candidatus Sumerlaeota bacterium]|jgi:tRNA threonylcarbamoyladenosine biosynthesis protein TsaB|nr:tRNA (adenosine(37)-N6)-threonylcarbamoyltransferase complex dimerization subunit type 1 TsaB [Candidatus Sumerlaeota bacterium]
MRILSFETATYSGGVGLLTEDTAVFAGPFDSRSSSREVLTAANRLLAENDYTLSDIDLVAVSTGPGLFTGVRIGMAIAQTLAFSGGSKPQLTGVSTLEAVAMLALDTQSDLQAGDAIVSVTDARRGEVYAALFEVVQGKDALELQRISEDIVARPELIAGLLAKHPTDHRALWLTGDGALRYQDVMPPSFGPHVRLIEATQKPLPLAVAEIGRRQMLAGKTVQPGALRPHYVRRPDARPALLTPSATEIA